MSILLSVNFSCHLFAIMKIKPNENFCTYLMCAAVLRLAESGRVVELTMLLCSQVRGGGVTTPTMTRPQCHCRTGPMLSRKSGKHGSQNYLPRDGKTSPDMLLWLLRICRAVSASSDSYIMGVATELTSDLQSSLLARSKCLVVAEERLSACITEAKTRVDVVAQTKKAQTLRHTLAARELWRKVI